MKSLFSSLVVTVVSLSLNAACADRSEGARVPPDGPSLGAPHIPWSKKTHEERMAFMGAHVEPGMKKLFVEFDSSYESFDCETCHGRDMELIDFEMPNDIYPLSADDPVEDAMGYDEDVAKFMVSKVVPAMARLMSKPAGKEGGVNCFTCHPSDE